MTVDNEKVQAIGAVLNNPSRPLKERFRALFTLRNIGGSTAIECISRCFSDPSALLKHELAYCLGQMQDSSAIPILIEVLEDKSQEPMVRHEAGEALGAIGKSEVLDILDKFSSDSVVEVAETCQLAARRIRWMTNSDNSALQLSKNPYNSVDPTPPETYADTADLRRTLLDDNKPLFNRYRAMFSLRNKGDKESILALAEGLKFGGALFKHEIAYVLGQVQHEACVPQLIEVLKNEAENEMVRHECAEALGSIATEECMKVLEKYLEDSKQVVRESCVVALDMCEYETSSEFQYADTLAKVQE